MATLLTLALLAATIAVVSAPLLAARKASEPEVARRAARRAELGAAREAKYREIRDTELDYRTGKLSREDHEAINAALRAEAVTILDALQSLEAEHGDHGSD